mmetsp:Transcript_6984/g.42797  ORF Transcript_6984/g.42797 Transcript_6984/m.42797 type:complete len:117 (+) Transcript_6984:262-612(+)
MPRHNNIIPNVHCHKDWQSRVKTWFNQPARKKRRRDARAAKAKAISPRPVKGMLRPIVHGSTIRYNMKTKLGRGFTLDELKVRKKHTQRSMQVESSAQPSGARRSRRVCAVAERPC